MSQEVQELKAKVERLRTAGELVFRVRDKDGITTSGLKEKFNEMEKALTILPFECLAKQHHDDLAVDRFATAMRTKLTAARAKGRSGWDDKDSCSGEHLAQLLIEHLAKGNTGTFEDIANFAMMLHQRGEDPQLLRTALVLRDAEIKAQAVEAEYKDLLHVVANQYAGNDGREWSTGANHVFMLFAKEINKRVNQVHHQRGKND